MPSQLTPEVGKLPKNIMRLLHKSRANTRERALRGGLKKHPSDPKFTESLELLGFAKLRNQDIG
ncbi:Protein of unknown function [Pyronema omphalodes CBS 100304]|uniref:Uncharacterized protein n=1 Tax=Pyronema omphalodes (strain CBS 100304) TaxID=1076935 RepID=U4LA50_PYROM|nr:Protein of unknown function [Pyronema omphalodes CBS 100304]